MSCHQCHNPIVIQTDPENTTYLCKTGVRIKVESFDVADANTLELGHSHDTKQQLLSNPLYKLECMALEAASGVSDPVESKPATTRNAIARYKGPTQIQESGTPKLNPDTCDKTVIDDKLDELLAINEINNADWYLSNAALRRKFRNEKKQLKTNPNVMVDLLPENERDVQEAKRVTFLSQSKKIKAHFKSILKKDTGIFSRTCGSSSGRGSTIEDKKRRLQFIKHIDTRLKHRV
nr:cell cycle control related protein, putative [Babesia bovis]